MKRFLAMLAAGTLMFGLSTSAEAQVRAVGASALILDDNAATPHPITIQTPQPGSQAYTDWSNAGFPKLQWSVPVPPATGAQSGFVYPGPQNVNTGSLLLSYWIYPGQTSNLSGSPVSGGTTGTWNYTTLANAGIVTTASGTTNRLAKFDAATDLTNSLLSDNGTTLSYNSGVFSVTAATGATTVGGQLTANGTGAAAISVPNGGITSGTPGTTRGTLTLADPASAFSGTLETATLTANRTYQLPDRTGQFFATTSQTAYTDIVLLQAGSIQQMSAGTQNGIAIQELAGATGAFQVYYDQFGTPLFQVGNTGNLISNDYINVSNTTSTSSISSGIAVPTTLSIVSAGGVGTVGVNLGASGAPETGLNIQSTQNDLVLYGQGQSGALALVGGGTQGAVISAAGGGYDNGLSVEAIGTANGNYAIQATADNTTLHTVDAVNAVGLRAHSNGAAADGMVTPVSTIADGGSPIMAVGAATTTKYSNGITIKNGAFATAGAVQPAGKMTGVDAFAANTAKTIRNPLCTSDAIIILTAANEDAATAEWYVSSVADGSFVIKNHTATASANASNVNYFIITPVSR